jgi:ribose transport system substrate-binding protein
MRVFPLATKAGGWVAAGLAATLVLTACGSSAPASSGGTDGKSTIAKSESMEAKAETLNRLYGKTTDIPEVVLAGVARADKPVSDETLAQAMKCYQESSCDTGHGTLTVALADGFGENVWRQVTRMEFILQALSYPEVKKIVYTNASGSATKAISDLRGLIAQKADIITGFFDAGEAVLPTVKQATAQGILVVPYDTPIGGEAGKDYLTTAVEDLCVLGKNFAETINTETKGQGNVVLLGGTPGNPLSAAWQACEKPALAPGIKIVGEADTNWTQQGTFQAMSGFLSSNDKIDAISYEYGDGFLGGIRAYEDLKRPINTVLTLRNDENNLFCEWKKQNNPNFKVYYSSGGGYYARLALTAGMMKLQGYDVPANMNVPQQLNQVTASTCRPDLPGPAPVSTLVPANVLKAMFP